MQISKEDKVILGVGIIFMALLAMVIFLAVNWFDQKKKAEQNEAAYNSVIAERAAMWAKEKTDLENEIKQHEHNSDSVSRVIAVIEKQKAQQQIYYQNKINALKNINTYSARQHYSDSLSGTIH